jgi:hypothetical protein
MTKARRLFVLPLVMFTLAAGSAFADQQHIAAPSDVLSTMAGKVATQDADRAAVREALARPEVQTVASSMGVDLVKITAAVDTMSPADIAQAASTARQVNQQLVGGASTIVISTTTIIIALLIILLIIVIAK